MSDDVDDLLRRTMATLDRQVPPGYFDTLPARTLARLDDPAIADAPLVALADDAPREPGAFAGPVPTPLAPRVRSKRGAMLAVAGLGLAAAAGALLWVSTSDRNAGAPEPQADFKTRNYSQERSAVAQEQAVAAKQDQAPQPAAPDAPTEVASDDEPRVAQPSKVRAVKPSVGKQAAPAAAGSKGARTLKSKALDETLSADDFKRRMDAIAAEVRACGAGARGRVALRLTVEPTGRPSGVAVTGAFAGTPVGACVERAVAALRFPARDGAPQTFEYSYGLSE